MERGFRAVKMRVGAMDRRVETSAARTLAARGLGRRRAVVDSHGTFSSRGQALRADGGERQPALVRGAHALDDVEAWSCAPPDIPIAVGESLSTRFEFRDVLERRAAGVLQPDVALVGGITEARRVAALAETAQVELAPHLWGSAVSYWPACTSPSPARPPHPRGLPGRQPPLRSCRWPPIVEDGQVKAPKVGSRIPPAQGAGRRVDGPAVSGPRVLL